MDGTGIAHISDVSFLAQITQWLAGSVLHLATNRHQHVDGMHMQSGQCYGYSTSLHVLTADVMVQDADYNIQVTMSRVLLPHFCALGMM
jgi:hypothetical protein